MSNSVIAFYLFEAFFGWAQYALNDKLVCIGGQHPVADGDAGAAGGRDLRGAGGGEEKAAGGGAKAAWGGAGPQARRLPNLPPIGKEFARSSPDRLMLHTSSIKH